MNRAYSLLHVKSANAETRTITGTATTPEPDRMGDIIEPLGASFANPLPLLLHHNTRQPVGRVVFEKPTKAGIDFEATIPIIDEPGALKDRIDEAWQSIKAGLIAGVSIGFRALEHAFMDGGGIRFLKTEILELSLVTVPANASATIASIKSLDLAATGRHAPGVPGILPIVRVEKGAHAMTIQEQIGQFEKTRATKDTRQAELMTLAAAGNVTLDAAQSEEYDTLASEVKAIDAHLVRLRDLERTNAARATPILPVLETKAAGELRGGMPIIQVKSLVEPGTGFVRFAQALLATKGNIAVAAEYAKRPEWDSTPEVAMALKAAVAAGTTTDAVWAGPLAPLKPLATEFLALLRPATILGKVPSFKRVPFNTSVPIQTGGGTYKWVGQGAPKPVGTLAFGTLTLGITKCAGIIVITDELARNSTPAAESVIRADMIAGIAQFLDVEFTDPAKAAVAGVSPGSITNGVTPITTAGGTPANARTDLQALINAMTAAGISTAGAVLLMSETNAAALGSALNPLGQSLFPGLGPTGGSAMGITVIASQTCGANVILVQPETVLYADDGGVTIDVSTEASVQMDSAPVTPDATTVFTSLWQNNLVGLRAERYINWKRGRTGGVQYTVATYVV